MEFGFVFGLGLGLGSAPMACATSATDTARKGSGYHAYASALYRSSPMRSW